MIFMFKVIHYCWQTNLKKFEKIYELDPVRFPTALGLTWQATLKKIKAKLDF